MKTTNEYDCKLIDLLQKQIIEQDGKRIVQIDYDFKDLSTGRTFRFDLVELSLDGSILKVYECITPYFYHKKENLNTLIKQLRLYGKITKAQVFLAYSNYPEKTDLHIKSLQEIEKESRDNPYVIESFSDFYNALNKLRDEIQTSSYRLFFRGQPNNEYEPIPSIYRKKNVVYESKIYHEAVRRKPEVFNEETSTFDNLVKMQHYELPTRLLDITKNPMYALYFACLEAKNEHGVEAAGEVLIYLVPDSEIKFYDSDSVCILANLAKRPITFDYEDDKSYLIYDIKKDRPSFNGKILRKEAIHEVVCVLPKLNNDRIIKQDGAFFIFGIGLTKYEPAPLQKNPYIITIKADAKKQILKELDLIGVNEASLFPETDKVMQQIKREFL